ncbi:MAG: hypothetical protein NTU73_05905, partial [Ignavibacteriae bacterium]|nr:hypothetical protein [Ignavibacteriota bacterium]
MNIPFNNKIFFAYKFSECDYLQQTRFLFDYDSLMNDVNNKLLYYKSAPALVPDNDLYKVVLTKIDKIKKLDNNISFLERTIEKEYKYRNESLKKRLYFPELNKEESNFDNCIEIMFLIRKPDYIPVINELIETKESCTQKEINNLLIPFINEYYKLNLNDSYIDKFRLIYNDFFSYQIYIELLILKLEDLKTLKSQNEYDNSKKMEFIKSLEEYKNSKNKYDFSNYLFNHNEEFVLLFSNQLESNEDKITYLKYVYSLT